VLEDSREPPLGYSQGWKAPESLYPLLFPGWKAPESLSDTRFTVGSPSSHASQTPVSLLVIVPRCASHTPVSLLVLYSLMCLSHTRFTVGFVLPAMPSHHPFHCWASLPGCEKEGEWPVLASLGV